MDTVMGILIKFRNKRIQIEEAAKCIDAIMAAKVASDKPADEMRDGFAAAALIAYSNAANFAQLTDADVAERAYDIADAMIMRRGQK